jgi:hypothetical protein
MTSLRSHHASQGDVVGQQILVAHPVTRGATVQHPRFDPTAPGSFVVHSCAGDDPLPHPRSYQGRAWGSLRPRSTDCCPSAVSRPDREEAERSAYALTIWREAGHPSGTPVQLYLGHCGFDLPTEAAGEAIRYHPECRL